MHQIKNFNLNFDFLSSGLATLQKKNENNLNPKKNIKERKFTLRNLLRKLKLTLK